jgi:hypothetical protein
VQKEKNRTKHVGRTYYYYLTLSHFKRKDLIENTPDNRFIGIDDATVNGKSLLIWSLDMNNVKICTEESFDSSLSRIYTNRYTTEDTSDFQPNHSFSIKGP